MRALTKNGVEKKSTAGKYGRWCGIFIKALAQCPYVTHACEIAGITQPAVYLYRKSHPQFAEEWDKAVKKGWEKLERQVYNRAGEGSPDWTWIKGKNGRLMRKPLPPKASDALAVFLLKAHNPKKYRETVRNEITGASGGPIEVRNARPLKTVEESRLRELMAISSNGESHETKEG